MAVESKTRELLADIFIKALDEEKLPWSKGWSTDHVPFRDKNYSTGYEYNGINKVMLEVWANEHGYASNEWMTLPQANKLGFFVKKGEHGVPIEKFEYYDRTKGKAMTMKEYYERKMSEDPEVRDSCYMFIKNYTVFNALQFPKLKEQIEKDLAEKYKSEEEKNIAYGRISHQKYAESVLMEYCKNEGIKIDVSYTNDASFYEPKNDKIVLPERFKFHSDVEYVHTLCHEIAHSTLKDTRLNRPSSAKFGSRDYAIEELRAEIASSFYLAEFGLVDDILDDRKAYIQGWSEKIKKDHKVLFEAIKDAEKIVDYIKEKGGYDRALETEKRLQETKTGPVPVQPRRGRGR